MKKTRKLAIIAVIALIGLMILPLTGCSDGDNLSVQRITVTTPPTKTTYAIGDSLDKAGMVVSVVYSDGSRKAVTGYSVGTLDSSTAGVKQIMVTYQKMTAPFSVTVNPNVVSRPAASPSDGTYFTAQSVTLSTITEGASIYYTLDGSTPTASSTLYSSPITVNAKTTLKAIAVKDGWENSAILTLGYYLTKMTENTWTDGYISGVANFREQWFKFTATAGTQYIYFQNGTLTSVKIQIYDTDGTTTVETEKPITSTTTPPFSQTVTIGKEYNIKVTADNGGTFKLAFSSQATIPETLTKVTIPTAGVTTLTEGAYALNGNVPTAGSEQWFKFTATDATQIFYFIPGTSSGITVQLYKADGTTVEASGSFTTTTQTLNRTVTSGETYYIKVTPTSTGTFKIGFTKTSDNPPSLTVPTSAITMTVGIWADGNIPTPSGEQWFKFTATDNPQYILFNRSADSQTSMHVQLYDKDGKPSGGRSNPLNNTTNSYRPVIVGDVYYIHVFPATGTATAGKYKLAISKDSNPIVAIPTGAPTLSANTWTNGSITAGGDQWFKFTTNTTATLTDQYIHFLPDTLDDVYIQLFDSSGVYVGVRKNLYKTNYTSFSSGGSGVITTGTVYYIRVWPKNSAAGGTYKLTFSTSPVAPN